MAELSPRMQTAMDALAEQDGLPVKLLGRNTVEALMRRGLVELDAKMEHYLPPSEHTHAWKTDVHLDGCHFFQSGYSCECGARRGSWTERSRKADPYSAVWMEQTGEEPCRRCEQLQNGARPQHVVTTVRAHSLAVA
jgi:hypothetical protein